MKRCSRHPCGVCLLPFHGLITVVVVVMGSTYLTLNLMLVSSKDTDSSALEEEGDDLKALEAKIRCLGMKKKPSNGNYLCVECSFVFCLVLADN